MMLRRVIDWATGRVANTGLYWTVKPYVDEIEERLEKTTWRWFAGKVRTSVLVALSNGLGWLPHRLFFRSVLRHRKRMTDPSTCQAERRRELFLGVMACLKLLSANKGYRFNWSGHNQRRSRVPGILHSAGVKISHGQMVKPWAMSAWEGKVPHIKFDPHHLLPASMSHTLFHELFHLSAPAGPGLERHGHVREVLAHRFAVEMSQPFPAVVHAGETNADILFDRAVHFEELLWATCKRMLVARIPITREWWKGHMVVQAPEDFSPRALEIDGHPAEQDLRHLLLWATSSLVDFYPPHASWSPFGDFPHAQGNLSFLSNDGLYYRVGTTAQALIGLAECGVLDPRQWVPGQTSHYTRDVPKMDVGGRTIGAGRSLVVHRQLASMNIPGSGDAVIPYHHLTVVEDGDGDLASAWAEAAKRGEAGPLLLPRDRRLTISGDWWSVPNVAWLDGGPFDAWKDTIDKMFMGTPFSSSDLQRRATREELLLLEIFEDHDSGEPTLYWANGKTTHPAFRAHRMAELLLEHDRRRGTWKVAQEPVHSWAEELSDHPVLLRAAAEHRRWWLSHGERRSTIKQTRQSEHI